MCPHWYTTKAAHQGSNFRVPNCVPGPHPLILDDLVFERYQVRVIELKLPLEGPISQAAQLAQERNRFIHHRDKVYAVSSLPGAQPPYSCASAS